MQTIAKHARVAVSTVSRALVNHPSIPRETCERIQEVARTLGYRPNPLVSALMRTRRSPRGVRDLTTVALITGYTNDEMRTLAYVSRFVTAASKRAESLGYRIETFHVTSETEVRRLDHILGVRGVQGVLIGLFPASRIALPMTWERYSFAAIGFNVTYPIGHRAENNQSQAMELALDQAWRRGYRRIGLAMRTDPQVQTEAQFRRAFSDWQRSSGVAHSIPVLEGLDWQRARFESWFGRNRPDCVLSAQSEVLEWINAKRLRRRVGFISMDLHPDANDSLVQRVAGVVQNYEAVGAAAFDLVEAQLHRNERGIPENPKIVVLDARWKDGASLSD